MAPNLRIINGDALTELRKLPDRSVQCCVTSPPYWAQRNYEVDGQIGQENSPSEYITVMVEVFGEVYRVLRDDGILWLNLGDSYASSATKWGCSQGNKCKQNTNPGSTRQSKKSFDEHISHKDLIGIPWQTAFALQKDGWLLRSACPWLKRNTMPESVTDRPASAIEYVFLLTKTDVYFYDTESVKVKASDSYTKDGRWKSGPTDANVKDGYEAAGTRNPKATHKVFNGEKRTNRNRRNSDWFFESWQGLYEEDGEPLAFIVNPCGFPGSHFATFPRKLIEPCIMAGSRQGDVVLDPFLGSGTTGLVALELGRCCIGIELNSQYCQLARERTATTPGLPM